MGAGTYLWKAAYVAELLKPVRDGSRSEANRKDMGDVFTAA